MAEIDPDTPEQTAQGGPAPEEGKKPEIDPAQLQSKLETLEQRLNDRDQLIDVLRQQLAGKPAEKEPEPKEPEIDDLSDIDLVDIVSGNKVDGMSKLVQAQVKQALKAMGVTTQKDVERLVNERATQMAEGSRILQDFPDLADRNSDLYKETEKQLGLIGQDPALSRLPDATQARIAAERAELRLARSGKTSSRRDSAEADRLERIGYQQGSTGSRSRGDSDRGEELSESQKLAASIYGVSEDDYKKHRKEMRARSRS